MKRWWWLFGLVVSCTLASGSGNEPLGGGERDGSAEFGNAAGGDLGAGQQTGAPVDCVPGGRSTDEFGLPPCEDGAVPPGDAGSFVPPTHASDGGPDAALACDSAGTPVSCCDAVQVPGGDHWLGRCGPAGAGCSDAYDGYDTDVPEHDATVSPFVLDRFEVTVGRYRRFVEAYDGTPPAEGAGAHPLIPGSGWQSAWNPELPSSRDALIVNLGCPGVADFEPTWTDAPGIREGYPINCVTWYEAFAFCTWEGKRLPTNAEWEFVAAGAAENRLFPWGDTPPTAAHANSLIGKDPTVTYPEWLAMQFVPVGSYPLGVGRWGHLDLAGNMAEWVLDTVEPGAYPTGTAPCIDCALLVPGPSGYRTLRGGNIHSRERDLRSAARGLGEPQRQSDGVGFRCAQ